MFANAYLVTNIALIAFASWTTLTLASVLIRLPQYEPRFQRYNALQSDATDHMNPAVVRHSALVGLVSAVAVLAAATLPWIPDAWRPARYAEYSSVENLPYYFMIVVALVAGGCAYSAKRVLRDLP